MKTMFKEQFHAIMPLEQLELYSTAIELFERMGFDSVFEPLQELIMLSTSHLDTEHLVGEVQLLLDDALFVFAENFGVTLHDSTPTDFSIQLVTTLSDLDNYYLPQELIELFSNPIDPEDAVAEAVNLLTMIPKEVSLEYIVKVDPSLIDRVLMVMMDRVDSTSSITSEDNREKTLRVQLLNVLLKDSDEHNAFIVNELINAKVNIQTVDFDAVVNQYAEQLFMQNTTTRTFELLTLYWFSNADVTQLYTKLRQVSEEFSEESKLETSDVNRLLGRYKTLVDATISAISRVHDEQV